MEYIVGALAVTKTVHLLELALPRSVMPWVKVVAGVVLGYGAAALLATPHVVVDGLVVATLASGAHGVLRLLTLLGDLVIRRTIR